MRCSDQLVVFVAFKTLIANMDAMECPLVDKISTVNATCLKNVSLISSFTLIFMY